VVLSVDIEDARMIGGPLAADRKIRDKSLEVIAGLAGSSAPTLSRIETGKQELHFPYCRSSVWPMRCKLWGSNIRF
jgi:hypothetical protein